MLAFFEFINKLGQDLITASILAILAELGRRMWRRLRRTGWRSLAATANNWLQGFLNQQVNFQISYYDLLVTAPQRLLAFSMVPLFYMLGLCIFFLGIVEHNYSLPHAFLVSGTTALIGHLLHWFMRKM